MVTIEQEILDIINENSGGIKFIELVAILTEKGLINGEDNLLKILKDIPAVKILKYSWHMSPDLYREKFFICTV